jgi:1-acyl-sn-glycerol-3-phosphate acyltransferase
MAQRSFLSRAWYAALQRLTQLTAVLAFRVRCTGMHNLPAEGGVLVVANHQSHLDPPLVGLASRRRMNYLARASLFVFPPFRWLIHSLDAIPIDREGIGVGGIKESLRRLKRGEIVVMFPEGTRSRDGEIGTFHAGFATLAVRSKAAILPVAVDGAFDAWPRRLRFPRLGNVHVHYGAPLMPADIAKLSDGELQAEVERRVRECLETVRRHPQFAHKRQGVD